ncbi:MAG TPA: HIT domain-containing protein [Verrucomicrobiae bacterium]|jgi:diadenosine tetraphosphate (Ap4A) HIT family hydrolase|nr:HIT domain-containing protein [Verrucomicrobiae bacterium]
MSNNPNDCSICGEIRSRSFSEELQRVYGVGCRICAETEDFIALPTVSPLVTGHMLIFPKRHVPSLTVLPPDHIRTLTELATHIVSLVSSETSAGYVFEHGVLEDGNGSCGITHAHLHIIPLQFEIATEVTRQASLSFPPQRVDSLESVLSRHPQPESPYLLFGESLSAIRFTAAPSIPSQLMRRLIATQIGKLDWNWRNYTGVEEFQRTINKIGRMIVCPA